MPETEPGDATPRARLVTPKVAAEYCGVHPQTVRRWIAEGRLAAYRTGPKLLRVDLETVRALVVPA